jgi:hypothetical protein
LVVGMALVFETNLKLIHSVARFAVVEKLSVQGCGSSQRERLFAAPIARLLMHPACPPHQLQRLPKMHVPIQAVSTSSYLYSFFNSISPPFFVVHL